MIEEALADAKVALMKGNWVSVKTVGNRKLVLDYGTIHSNGEHEQAIVTVNYELIGQTVLRNKMVHS